MTSRFNLPTIHYHPKCSMRIFRSSHDLHTIKKNVNIYVCVRVARARARSLSLSPPRFLPTSLSLSLFRTHTHTPSVPVSLLLCHTLFRTLTHPSVASFLLEASNLMCATVHRKLATVCVQVYAYPFRTLTHTS